MRQWQAAVLLTLLAVVFLFFDAALCYMGMETGGAQSGFDIALVWIGTLIAQPGLLAIWAALGAESLFVRLPRAFFLVCLVFLAVTWGTWLNQGGHLDGDAFVLVLLPLCQFAISLVPFWLTRRYRGWQIVGPHANRGMDSSPPPRFSLMRLFAWQTLIAVMLFAGIFLFHNSRSQGYPIEVIGYGMVIGASFSFFSLPIVFSLGATLGRQKKVWYVFSGIGVAGFVYGSSLFILYLVNGKLGPEEKWQFLTVFVSLHVTSFVALLFVRAMGYRLVRMSGDGSADANTVLPLGTKQASRRFAILVSVLLLIFLATLPLALDLREARALNATKYKLSHLGARASTSGDGNVAHVSFIQGKPVQDEALAMLDEWPQLWWLKFTGTSVTDQQLKSVSRLTNIERLYLDNTDVTDTGLEHLKVLTSLQELHLRGSKVSVEGVLNLQKSLPDCQIVHPFPVDLPKP